MSKIIDARGLSCPHPVLMTLEKIKSGEDNALEILVDTDTSRENVSRAAYSQGWVVTDECAEGGGYKITIRKN